MPRLYYFAYGSNLHPARFYRRVPSARVVTTAVLPGYKLTFEKHGADDSGKCSIVPDTNEAVQGVVYEIAAAERPGLDALEGGYDCRQLVVNTVKGMMRVYVYIARHDMIQAGLVPYHWYKLYVLHGARQQGLDADYYSRIEVQCSVDDPDIEREREHFRILGIEWSEVVMTNERSHLPLASEEMENNVREVFPIKTDPEEFAARDGVGWMDFTFHEYRFSDPELDSWIHTVGRIVTDPQALEQVQRKYLSEAEFMAVRKYMEDDDLEEDTDF